MFQRVPPVTLCEKCQRRERWTFNCVKNIARECMLGSTYILQLLAQPNSRCRDLEVTKPANPREEGVTASLLHLMALGLMGPRGALCQDYTRFLFQDLLHLTLLTALHPSDMFSKQASVTSRVRCTNSTLAGFLMELRTSAWPFWVLLLSHSELGHDLALAGGVLPLRLLLGLWL